MLPAGFRNAQCREAGMQLMDDAIYELYMKSRITMEHAVAYAKDTEAMKQKVRLF